MKWNSFYDKKFLKNFYGTITIIESILGIILALITYFVSHGELYAALFVLCFFLALSIITSFVGRFDQKISKKDLEFGNPKRTTIFRRWGDKLILYSIAPLVLSLMIFLFVKDSELRLLGETFFLIIGLFMIGIGVIYKNAKIGSKNYSPFNF